MVFFFIFSFFCVAFTDSGYLTLLRCFAPGVCYLFWLFTWCWRRYLLRCCRADSETKGWVFTQKLFVSIKHLQVLYPVEVNFMIWLSSSGGQLAGPRALPPPARPLRPEGPLCGWRWRDGKGCGRSPFTFRDLPRPDRAALSPTQEPKPAPVPP